MPLAFLTIPEMFERVRVERESHRVHNSDKFRWGDWVYDPAWLTLTYQGSYEVDLEQIRSSAELCDWIYQVHSHRYGTEDFIAATRALLDPQDTLCSYGENLTPPPFTRERIEQIRTGP